MFGGKCEIETYDVEFKWEITEFSKVRTLVESKLTKDSSFTIQSNEFYSKLKQKYKKTWYYLKLECALNDSYNIKLNKSSEALVAFSVQFFILNNEQKKEKLNDVTKLYFNKCYNEDYTLPVASKYFKDEKYLINDTFTIICNLVEYGNPITRLFPSVEDNPKSLSTDINNLLTSGQCSDVTLMVNETEFKVHKLILIARSPVFAAMFSHKDLKESETNQVVIKDTNVEAVKKFLEFIYSDNIETFDKEKFDLWILADKYQIETLKKYCENYIYDKVDAKCVLEVLEFAHLYNIQKLLDKALEYFVTYCKNMMKNDEWKTLAKKNPDLVVLTLDRLGQHY